MGSSQYAPVQQVVNTNEQFGYHPATKFKFFVGIGFIAGVTIFALAIWRHKKALDVSVPLCVAKVLRKAMQQDAYIEYARTRSPQLTTPATMPLPPILCSLTSTKTLEQWGFFLLVILPVYMTMLWCLLYRPIRTSLFQFNGNHGLIG